MKYYWKRWPRSRYRSKNIMWSINWNQSDVSACNLEPSKILSAMKKWWKRWPNSGFRSKNIKWSRKIKSNDFLDIYNFVYYEIVMKEMTTLQLQMQEHHVNYKIKQKMNRYINIYLLWSSDERGDHAPASKARTSCDQ